VNNFGTEGKMSKGVILLLWIGAVATATATVHPAGVFTDGSVLQQGRSVRVWGTAATEFFFRPRQSWLTGMSSFLQKMCLRLRMSATAGGSGLFRRFTIKKGCPFRRSEPIISR